MDKEIEEHFKIWSKNIQPEEVTEKNNELALNLFKQYRVNRGFDCISSTPCDDELNQLKFSLENRLEVYINNKELLGLIIFGNKNGGRPGLVHGGCLFMILYLCINHLFKKAFRLEEEKYGFKNIQTVYKRKVPINNYMVIIARINEITKEIQADLIDYEDKVCTSISCKYVKLESLNKF